jgi:hypothetical protein
MDPDPVARTTNRAAPESRCSPEKAWFLGPMMPLNQINPDDAKPKPSQGNSSRF